MTEERLMEITRAAIEQGATAEAQEILGLAHWALVEKAAAKRRLDKHRTRQRAKRAPKKRGRTKTFDQAYDFYKALASGDSGRGQS